jgi:hypothetical protein
MVRIGLCQKENNLCEKKDTCLRYIQEFGELMNIIAVCNKENNYERYWKTEVTVEPVKEDSVSETEGKTEQTN